MFVLNRLSNLRIVNINFFFTFRSESKNFFLREEGVGDRWPTHKLNFTSLGNSCFLFSKFKYSLAECFVIGCLRVLGTKRFLLEGCLCKQLYPPWNQSRWNIEKGPEERRKGGNFPASFFFFFAAASFAARRVWLCDQATMFLSRRLHFSSLKSKFARNCPIQIPAKRDKLEGEKWGNGWVRFFT